MADLPVIRDPAELVREYSEAFTDGEAVDADFILRLKEGVDDIPQHREQLRRILEGKGIDVGPDTREWYRSKDGISRILDFNEHPELTNPYGIYSPHRFRISYWAQNSGIEDTVMNAQKNDVNDRFLKATSGFSIHYLGFLFCMNIADEEKRHQKLDELLDVFFEEPMTYGEWTFKKSKLNEISPAEDRMVWDTLNALTILISQEEAIKPAARYRALRALARYDNNALIKRVVEPKKAAGNRGISSLQTFALEAEDLLKRLPHSFRNTPAEQAEVVSDRWTTNSTIREIFGIEKVEDWYRRGINYAGGINRLINFHPHEAIQVCLLLLTEPAKWKETGLAGLVSMSQVDSVTAEQIFGYRASYLKSGSMAETIAEQVARSAGIVAFGEDPTEPYRDLSKEELLTVLRRLQETVYTLQAARIGQMARESKIYFTETSPEQIQRYDPKRYFQTLGLHPQLETVDMDLVVQATYRRLAKRYHPDRGEHPDGERMRLINLAYESLETREKRMEYRGNVPFTTTSVFPLFAFG